MKTSAHIVITDVIGKNSAVLHSDGLALYDKMKTSGSEVITLSFKGISHCTTAFLNASIGKFLIERPDKFECLKFEDIPDGEQYLADKIELVLDNARNEKKRANLNESSRNYFYA